MHQSWEYSSTNKLLKMDNKTLYNLPRYETSNIRLRFVAPTNIDTSYRSIMPTLLSEGKTSDEVRNLIDDAEHAYLILATHPMDPVAIAMSKVDGIGPPGIDLYVNIQLRCLNTLVLIKIEEALLSRIQPYTKSDDDDGGINADEHNRSSNNIDSTTFYKTYQQLEGQLDSLEKHYQRHHQGKEADRDDIWHSLQATWDLSRKVHHDRWLSLYDFNV
ncbi:hypothetical protein BC941DRAFT_204703 [Chlamydoabsidia padenii]|nr:hypothetical protein BC941DRAFT_204703 [Chlamydoabsidia padenii]